MSAGLVPIFVVYMGEGGSAVPQNVVRVRVDPFVTSIPAQAFNQPTKLAEVELCEGLVEIGDRSFACCEHAITKINIPNSLRRINDCAFFYSLRSPIRLHDGIESIGMQAFCFCIFTNFRVPPLITVIPEYMLYCCYPMFSVELSENTTEIKSGAFASCLSLRNVAFPPNAVFGDKLFMDGSDLHLLFGSEAEVISALMHRFDGLPIHRLVYYQSYHHNQWVLQHLIAAIIMRSGQRQTLRSELDSTGNHQDCLGMTPLHILACSSVHDLELYRSIVEKYPTNLITEDRWGALPLLYALWGAAPSEIIDFFLESYQALYPSHEFNWTMMMKTMGRNFTPKESIENLLCVRRMNFPEQSIDWEYLLDEFINLADPSYFCSPSTFTERMRFLFMCCMSSRVEGLAFKVWRDHIRHMIQIANFKWNKNVSAILRSIREKLVHFEDELPKLKEATTILELALWKKRINENNSQQNTVCRQKEIKVEGANPREQCRVTCGADIIIGHVLPYLISTGDDDSLSYESDTDDWGSDDDSLSYESDTDDRGSDGE